MRTSSPRRAFTLIELLIAGVVATLVLGSISVSLAQLGQAKRISKERFDAHLRADAALQAIRLDAASIVRTDDLFFTRLLLIDDEIEMMGQRFGRDELLLLNTRLRRIRNLDHFNGEGVEYETQYRIEEDDYGPVLWQRRDAMADENLHGGGVATPLVEGIIGINIEAFDGKQWNSSWDSDFNGLPHALRITVHASGHRDFDDLRDAPVAVMRTIVAIDRVFVPVDHYEAEEQERILLEAEELAAEADAAAAAAGNESGPGGGGDFGAAGRPGDVGLPTAGGLGAPGANAGPGGGGGGPGGSGGGGGRPNGGDGAPPRGSDPNPTTDSPRRGDGPAPPTGGSGSGAPR